MAIAINPALDRGQRCISQANLAQFAGVNYQLLVQKQTHRPIIMDGSTTGGAFKCASLQEVQSKIAQIPNPDLSPYLQKTQASNTYLTKTSASSTYLSKTDASNTYLGKNAKAASAVVADSANSVAGANVTGTVASATKATKATKATQDASGNVITSTYATKTELSDGLSEKLGKTEKAASASVADSANSITWDNVSGKPAIPATPKAYITQTWQHGSGWYRVWSDGWIEQGNVSRYFMDSDIHSNTISFSKPFTTTRYAFIGIPESLDSSSYQIDSIGFKTNGKTTTGIEITSGQSGNIYISWYACGY